MTRIKYTKELLLEASKNAKSIALICRNLGLKPVGGNYRTVTNKLELFGIDTSHFTGKLWNKGLKCIPETAIIPLDMILQENINYKSDTLKKRLIAEKIKENKCEICGYSENLELHHINGNYYDNRLENLLILCPNCHAKTDNYRGRNSKKNTTPETITKKYFKSHYCICQNCNKEFYSDRVDRTRKFCSRVCYNEYLRKIKHSLLIDKEIIEKELIHHTNLNSLAAYFHVSRPTIKKILQEYGLYDNFKLKYDFHSKKILQLDCDLKLIKEWPSITDAADSLGIDRTGISKVCLGKRRSAGGYIWKYQ